VKVSRRRPVAGFADARRAAGPTRAVRLVVAAVLPWTAAACFATRNDVRVLQQDIATARAESARADSARSTQFGALAAQLGVVNDSIRTLSTRALSFQGDARDDLRWLREQIIQVQELTGQSQRVIQQLRGSLEGRTAEMAAAAGGPVDSAGPGPNQLYQLALEQFQRGSFPSARQAFTDLLTRFPTADVAADATFYVAESYAGEKNAAAADSAYQVVVTRYPQSPRAATALYKRARARQAAGRAAEAKTLYDELQRRFPKSDEAELAQESRREAPRAPATRPRP
jgi:tol-pal system protein YbgF